MRIIVSFSGGKDSQACLIKAVRDYGKENVTAVFCDTGWEHPITYKHVDDVCNQLGVKLIKLKNGKVNGFQGLCIQMKCFPVATRRACTSMLKIKPMIDWVLNQDDSMIIIQGIRAGESKARAAMNAECSYFKEYYNPEIKKSLYRKRDVLAWCKTHDASILRPIFKWSAQDVIDYILANGQQPNPLYRKGAARVGCYPCIMSRQSEVKVLARDKEMLQRLIQLEKDVNAAGDRKEATFFPKGYIPERFCKTYNNGCPTVEEVVAYVNRHDCVKDIFQPEEGYNCMSLYHGLCE